MEFHIRIEAERDGKVPLTGAEAEHQSRQKKARAAMRKEYFIT